MPRRLPNIRRVDYADHRTYGWLVQVEVKGV